MIELNEKLNRRNPFQKGLILKFQCVQVAAIEAVTLQLNSPLGLRAYSDCEEAQSKMKEKWRRDEHTMKMWA